MRLSTIVEGIVSTTERTNGILRTINPRGDYSKERKQLGLASSQVFYGLVIENANGENNRSKCQVPNPE